MELGKRESLGCTSVDRHVAMGVDANCVTASLPSLRENAVRVTSSKSNNGQIISSLW
jgi:hypothetical protein